MYRKERGITLIALTITIIVMLILASVAIKIGSNVIDRSALEDIKTNMLAIQGKAKIIAEKHTFDPDNPENALIGTAELDSNNNYNASGYTILPQLRSILQESGRTYYIWTETELNAHGLTTIKTDSEKFYIVDYGTIEDPTCEVFYSKGYNGIYKLSELKDM